MVPMAQTLDEVLGMIRVFSVRLLAARLLPVLLVLPLLAASAPAAVQNTPVCRAPFDQFPPVVVQNGTGGALIAWADYRSGDLNVYVQSTSSAGVPQWTADGVRMCKVAGSQINPRVAADGAGGGVVVWQDTRAGGDDIYAQRVSSVGVAAWALGGVPVCAAAGTQEFPQVVADGSGGVLIAWVDRRGAGADVYVQHLNAAGSALWAANGVALCGATGDQTEIALVPDGLGGAIAVWKDLRSGTADIYGQRVNGSGVAQWAADGVAVCAASGTQAGPAAVTDDGGGVVVTWADNRGATWDVYAQRMSGAGTPQWTADGVPLCVAAGDQLAPRLCRDGTSGVIVAWQDARGGTSDIYARRVNGSGVAQWAADGVVVCAAAADQTSPSIFEDPSGGALISWGDSRTPANGSDIYAQRVSGAGAAMWTANGVALCDTTGNQDSPSVISDGQGGAAAAWRDYRPGVISDLYSQNVDAGGAVPGQCPAATTVLGAGTLVTALSAQNYYDVPVANYYWSGVGVRSPAGTDWDIELYVPVSFGLGSYPVCFGTSVAGSYGSSGVDFVIADFGLGRTPPDTYGARASRYSGTGSGTVEWDLTATLVAKDCGTGGACGAKSGNGWTDVLDVWDVYLFAGTTYTFDFTHTGTADIKFLLFAPPGGPGPYITSRGAREFETTSRYTVYTAPVTDTYGMVLVNDNGSSGTYLLRVVTGIPAVGVGDGPQVRTGLLGVAPNPARGEAEVRFALSEPGAVSFRVVDMAGRAVGTIPAKHWGVGTWSVKWDGRGVGGSPLAAGVYFLQMRLDGRSAGVQRLALVR